MYAYIRGTITELYTDELVLETNTGVAYSLLIGPKALSKLAKKYQVGEEAEEAKEVKEADVTCLIGQQERFYTSFIVREDAQLLYAFLNRQDKLLFELLLTVPRIGAKLAQAIVDSLSPAELIAAVLQENTIPLVAVKGLGKKVAERVLLELKGKFSKLQLLVGADLTAEIAKQAKAKDTETASNLDLPGNLALRAKDKKPEQQMYEDLLSALMVLNFSLHESKQMLKLTFNPSLTVEENLKLALQSR